MLPPDSTIHDRYRIVYAVDERPGGAVYRARDERTGKLMLVAQIATEGTGGADLQPLASQVAAVRHDMLLPLVDHFGEPGAYYLVCEDVGGQDLERTLRSRGAPLPEGPTLEQVQGVLGLLEHLHEQKPALFLGDPTPTDLWVRDDGAWRLAPFALIRPIAAAPSPYRAPEFEHDDAEPTPASDLYALAALAYHALTGWAPPTGAQRTAGTPLNGPRALNPSLSTLAEQVLLRGLQLKRENRYQVARELHLSIEMVQMMDGRALGSGPDVTPSPDEAVPAPPDTQPVAPPPTNASAPQMASQPAPAGVYPALPQPAGAGPALATPQMPYPPYGQPYPPPARARRGISTGCLIAVAVLLTLAAVAVCAALAWFIPGSPLPNVFGVGATAPAVVEATGAPPAGDLQPTVSTSPSAASAGAGQATAVAPAGADPRAITLANAGRIEQTREITSAVLGPVAYSPDGQILAVGVGSTISLQDAETLEGFEPPRRLEGHADQVFTLAWSPDNRLLASGAINDNVIRLWNTGDGSLVRELRGHTGWLRAVAFSPDGRLLASGSYDHTVRLWDVASGSPIATLSGHGDLISTVAFSPDGATLASSAADGTVRMWNAANGQQRTGFVYDSPMDLSSGEHLWATGLSFTPDGATLAIGLEDGTVAIVDAATGELRRTLTGHTAIVVSRGVAFAPDGRTLATASFDGTVRLWDVASGAQKAEFAGHRLRVLSIAFSPDGARLASTSDQGGQLFVWDVTQSQDPRSFRVGQGLITWVTFSPDGSVLGTVGYNGGTQLYLVDQDESRALVGAATAGESLAFLGNNRIVLISDQGTIALIESGSPEPRALEGLDGRPLNVAASLDGQLIVAGSSTGAIGRWDGRTGAAQPAIQSDQLSAIGALAVSDDGALIAAGGRLDEPRIEVWDAASGQLRHTLSDGAASIIGVAFQPRGDLLAATDVEGKLRLWNAEDGTLVRTISATPDQRLFSAMTFSADGSMVVTGSPNGQVVFWNAQTGEAVANLPPRDVGVSAIAFSPDGRRLAFGLDDQTVRLFEVGQSQ